MERRSGVQVSHPMQEGSQEASCGVAYESARRGTGLPELAPLATFAASDHHGQSYQDLDRQSHHHDDRDSSKARLHAARPEVDERLRLKTYVCPSTSCGRMFKRLEHLKRHLRTHTSDRPHACPTCRKSFARNDNLAVHVRAPSYRA